MIPIVRHFQIFVTIKDMSATKIVATIGPASESREMIEQTIRAGVNIFRFNVKHNTPEWHKEKSLLVHEVSRAINIPVGVLFDLQGSEVRTGKVTTDIQLNNGEEIRLTAIEDPEARAISIPHDGVISRLNIEQSISIDDGRILLKVTRKENDDVVCEVIQGGTFGSNKSVVIPSVTDTAPPLTEQNAKFLDIAKEVGVDFVALSYIRSDDDVRNLRHQLVAREMNTTIIAKIETAQAVSHFEEILAETDGVMVARGDLGVSLPVEQVPYYQKHIIRRCIAVGKPVITATQMLESMINNPYPTRAEISDVANAIYDYTDAVMLSAETAIGKFPKESVETLVKTANFIEGHTKPPRVNFETHNQTDAITHAAVEFARQEYQDIRPPKAFVLLTESGYATRMIGRHRHHIPIIALTRHQHVVGRLLLQWGVVPLLFNFADINASHVTQIDEILETVRKAGILAFGDSVVMVYGSQWGRPGRNNVIQIEQL